MNTLDDFIRSWDNVVSPEKFIILRAPGTFIAMVRVDDFTVKIDSKGKEVLEFHSEGRWKARLYLEVIEGIEGGWRNEDDARRLHLFLAIAHSKKLFS